MTLEIDDLEGPPKKKFECIVYKSFIIELL